MVLPSLSRAHEMSLQAESNFVRTRLNLAVAAYQREHGSPPATLAALVPKYLPGVPSDPMTGFDFEYAPSTPHANGLNLITSSNEADVLRQKRRTPAILSPRAARWRRFVENYSGRHDFTPAQRTAAEAILRDVEARAAAFELGHGATLQSLIDSGRTKEAAKKLAPLDELFRELQKRVDRLPTAEQRAADLQGDGRKP
jgi:hypothetical protein